MPPETMHAKNYIDQAIQTEVQDSLFEPVLGQTHTLNHTGIELEKGDSDSAYTHSLATLAEPTATLHLLSSTPSAPASLRTPKRSQLLYSRPTESHVLAKRMVSLPEFPFEVPCDSRAAHDAAGMRIVSLPEAMIWSPQSTDKASYLDSFGTSVDTSHTSSGNDLGHRKLLAYSKLDIPRTPSPPSSPESVLIIDNDIHIPNLFLYGHSHKNMVTEDDGGWITWASSPPRPIPALHGPLSLPYARCPSGAEGTIIEDADLPRMIWGLDLEVIPPSATRNQRTMNAHKPTTEDFQSRLQAAPRKSQKQPLSAIYSPTPEICLLGTRHSYSGDAILKRATAIEDANKSARRHDFINTLRPPVDQPHGHNLEENRRLDRRETHFASSSIDTHINKYPLRSSAPVFVPATSEHIFSPRTIGSCASQIVQPRTLAAIDIARQYCMDQQKNTLLTPPTSSDPQWSPVFSDYAVFGQPGEYSFLQDQQALLKLSAALTPGIDHLEVRRRFIDPCSGKRSLFQQDMSSLVSDWTRSNSMHQHLLPNQASQRRKFVDQTSPRAGPTPSTLSMHPDTANFVGTSLPSLATTTPSASMEREVSIPYTHLKHRRLSSVAEEDAGPNMRNVSLPMKSRQHVYPAPNHPSESVVRLSNSRQTLSGFGDLQTPNTARVTLGPKAGLDCETTRSEFPQSRKPATPTVKLPLAATIFSSRKEIGTHRSPGKENASNAKACNNTLSNRGRAQKRNMNCSRLDDSQNSLSERRASADTWL